MNSIPFMQNGEALQKLGNCYLGAFWLACAACYVSLFQEGYQPQIALLAACAAAIACILIRRASKSRELMLDRALVATVAPLAAFIVKVNEVIRTERSSSGSIGLMLMSFQGLEDGEAGEVPGSVVKAIRGHVKRVAGSAVFQIDSRTLALVERSEDVADRLNQVSEELQGVFRALRLASSALTYARLTIGIAVVGRRQSSGAELFATARAAVELAEANARAIFVRHI